MCRLNCVGVEKSEYINVGVKKWLKKTAFRCKKVEAKKGYQKITCQAQFPAFHCCTTAVNSANGYMPFSPDYDLRSKVSLYFSDNRQFKS